MVRVSSPIFIVGSGRSGTTLVYELMCQHPDLGWFSNYVERWPKLPQLGLVSRHARLSRLPRIGRYMPRPVEGYRLWDSCASRQRPNAGPLDDRDVHPEERECINATIARIMRYQGKHRFVNKNTRNSVRVPFLMELFGDPFFIHVVRDPRAAVASMLRVPFWPNLPVWCEGGITPLEWRASGRDETVLAAKLWCDEVGRVLADRARIPEGRYLEIRYEDLVREPRRHVPTIFEFCGMTLTPRMLDRMSRIPCDDRNAKFRSQLNQTQIDQIDNMTLPIARNFK